MYRAGIYLLLIILISGSGCKSKKKPVLTGEEPVEINDFIGFFPEMENGYQAGDTILDKKITDSLLIGYKVFKQFVPDSVTVKLFGKNAKPRIHAIGKSKADKETTYILVRALTPAKKQMLLIAFDKKQHFLAAIPALVPDAKKETSQSFSFDRRQTLTRSVIRKNPDASTSEGKDVYVLNQETGSFILILTEALDDRVTELINPIDTLTRKQKFSADYGTGKMNLVSVRDGRKTDRVYFFIHIEKDNGACTGELKGEAKWIAPGKAVYRADGDPCFLSLSFTSGSVTLSEEGCGARHGLNCSFNGNYPKKKIQKQPTTANRKKSGK